MKYIKIFLCFLFLLPLNTFANELEIIYDCPKQINANEEFSCKIVGNTKLKVSGIEYEFSLPEDISFIRFEKDDIWEGDEENNLIIIYGLQDQTDKFPIGTVYLSSNKVLNNINVKTKYLVFSDDKYEDHIVVDKDNNLNVNEVKINSKKEPDKPNIFIICVIIILIILMIIGITIYIIKRRKKE